MATDLKYKFYIVLMPPAELRDIYFRDDGPLEDDKPIPDKVLSEVELFIRQALRAAAPDLAASREFRVVDLPSRRVRLALRPDPTQGNYPKKAGQVRDGGTTNGETGDTRESDGQAMVFDPRNGVGRIVILLEFDDPKMAERFNDVLPNTDLGSDYAGGVELPIGTMEHWCPSEATQPLFGDREAAERLIQAKSLKMPEGPPTLPVNIIMVDDGLKETRVPAGTNFRGGWAIAGRQPGQAESRHGSMVMRNALSFAADVKLYDCPLLPQAIANLGAFLSLAQAVYEMIFGQIEAWREEERQQTGNVRENASWVIVNAWGVHNRKDDFPSSSPCNYGENPDHAFNKVFREANDKNPNAKRKNIDVVFAAGNCGSFCPSPRCGGRDRGPGRSIHGANSHPEVLTAGAVRADGMWLGYSAEGPGQPRLSSAKPDVCASSQFGENGDFSPTGSNTGTSAASGLSAGVVAAIRNRRAFDVLSPESLRDLLRENAWRPLDGDDAERRFGHGIIDAETTVNNLP
jgi:hypothetical protein